MHLVRSEWLPVGGLAVGLVGALALSFPLSAHGTEAPGVIAVDEIKDGMKGYGLTVFKGTEPERFDVEVVGVLHNFRPAQDLILIKTPHPRLNITKNVRGMSGSPIYLNGRLAGAYAYSWSPFQVEPVAGVTPIAPMLAEMRRPIPRGLWPGYASASASASASSPLGGTRASASTQAQPAAKSMHLSRTLEREDDTRMQSASTWFDGPAGGYDLETHAKQVAARVERGLASSRSDLLQGSENSASPSASAHSNSEGVQLRPAATPLLVAGMTDRSIALMRSLFAPLGLEPMQAGGGSTLEATAPQHYVNGGAVGVQLTSGDVSTMGLGTVTHVEGTRLCAFGHPMIEGGVSALPAAIGKVHWIFASDQHSSKIGEAVRPLGALVQDRQSAIVVDETAEAPVFPVSLAIEGAPGLAKDRWNVTVAHDRFLTPALVASVFGSVIDASVNERRDVTWHMHTTLSVRGHGSIDLDDFGVAAGGMPEAGDFLHSRIGRAIGEVLNNPWEHARIDGVKGTLSLDYSRALWRLRGVDLLDPAVDVNQPARIRLHFTPFAGPEVTKVVEVRFGDEFAGKDVDVELAPGYAVTPDLAAPQSLADLLANSTRQSAPAKSLVLQYRAASQGVAYKSHVADRLPAFALDALRPVTSDVAPEPFVSHVRHVIALERYVEGTDRVRIRVRPVLR